jgi:hypothetical protein
MQSATKREMTMHKVLVSLALLVGVVLGASETSVACCNRKPDFGCCGNGPCNIFCCNCDNGCNTLCEHSTCSTGDWLKCGAICAACAAACVITEGEVCEECLGPSYNTCVKCYSGRAGSAGATAQAAESVRDDRTHFFHEIAEFDENPRTISLEDFANFVENRKLHTGVHAATASIPEMFRAFDVDGSGFIDRNEIDNDEVTHGLLYPNADSGTPSSR